MVGGNNCCWLVCVPWGVGGGSSRRRAAAARFGCDNSTAQTIRAGRGRVKYTACFTQMAVAKMVEVVWYVLSVAGFDSSSRTLLMQQPGTDTSLPTNIGTCCNCCARSWARLSLHWWLACYLDEETAQLLLLGFTAGLVMQFSRGQVVRLLVSLGELRFES